MIRTMGIDQVSEKSIKLMLDVESARLIRSALRFGQVNSERPFTYRQDIHASRLILELTANIEGSL